MHRGGRPDRTVDDAHLAAVHHADDLPHLSVVSLLTPVEVLGVHGIDDQVGQHDVVTVEDDDGALLPHKLDYGGFGLANSPDADAGLLLAEDDGRVDDVRPLLDDDVERPGVDGGGEGVEVTGGPDVDGQGRGGALA